MDASHRLGDAVGTGADMRRWHRRARERLDALERAQDGPPPDAALRVAVSGGPERLSLLRRRAEARLFDQMARQALRALAARRLRVAVPVEDGVLAALGRDLAACREAGLLRVCEL